MKFKHPVLVLVSLIVFVFASYAEAKRLGGGMSFGGKSNYSSPFKKSSMPKKSFSQQKAAQQNAQQKQQFANRGGLMGMLGGLALGGLLGALFFGGAFENINFFDILIIGGIIFAIYWFMKRKQSTRAFSHTQRNLDLGNMSIPAQDKIVNNDSIPDNTNQTRRFTDQFDHKFGASAGSAPVSSTDEESTTVILPTWFNQEEFLQGARSAFEMLQSAWDNGDLEQIKNLTTPSVYQEIMQQHQQSPNIGVNKILQLNAELVDFNEREEHNEAAVLFDALMSETNEVGEQNRASQVRELWHFVRSNDSDEPTWYLDGIQQLD